MEAVGTLAGGIAHDFNNILQPMLGFCELLKEDLPPGTPEHVFVDGILDAAMRAKELVNQILSFSRQEDEEAGPIRLQPVIKEAMKLLRASIPKTIDIEQTIDPDCGIVMADPTQFYQIVMNLCTNAYHAMEEEGGTLNLALEQIHMDQRSPVFPEMPPGDYALLKISDTGAGIPRTVLDKIFDPYFTTKEKAKGTGLGLSIVQGIVKRCNGDIRIYSEPGKGTEIHVYLPIMGKVEGNGKAGGDSRIQGGSERILLVDDEKPVAMMIHQMLERLGYRVTTRIGSMEALETFQSNPNDFDLVITDLTMPHMTGIQLAGEMIRIRENIPIILCTGFSEQSSDDRLKAAGIRAKLAKPVITRALAETIREVLNAVNSDL
jgi:CheY-like chemotaxis protein/two-component sensor histidine kinase